MKQLRKYGNKSEAGEKLALSRRTRLIRIERFLVGCTKEDELMTKKDISGGYSGYIIPDL